MDDFKKSFTKGITKASHRWLHYFEIYDRHFSRFKDKEVCIVEIGVAQGGSLQMWKNYFGLKAKIIGVDINPNCKKFEEDRIEVIIGDQSNKTFLKTLIKYAPKIDVLIDDGGHTMIQQMTTFDMLFPHVSASGIYLCEDLHTSYLPRFGGGYKNSNTFIEYSKNLIDYLNAWHSIDPSKLCVNEFTRSVYSLHYYDSVLVIEKRKIERPCRTNV